MKTRPAREEQSVTIGAALALFVIVWALCGVAVAALARAAGRDVARMVEATLPWAMAAAALAAAAYLVRHRR